MFDITDRNCEPSVEQLCAFVGNPLFDELCGYMQSEYSAVRKIEYSGEQAFLGWNLKFRKGGRGLCTVYPRPGRFIMLIVVGQKEKARVEAILPALSEETRSIYAATREGMGQRWLMFDLAEREGLYEDALKLIRIRRESA